MKMTETHIKRALYRFFSNQKYKLFNTYLFSWESDFISFTTAGYCNEIEIKISKSDFKADFKKTIHSGILKHEYLRDTNETYKPNKFWFACPEKLVYPDEIHEQYGLIWVNNSYSKIIRPAAFLHRQKLLESYNFINTLMHRFYYRNMDLRNEMNLREWDIQYGQGRVNYIF
jgi:hypothetical protein